MAGDVKKNPHSYLEHLEHKNKSKKIREEEEMKKNGHIMKREENFQLFFNGANDVRIRNSRKRSDYDQSKSIAARKQWTNNPPGVAPRRKWENPATPMMLKEQKDALDPPFPEIQRRSKEVIEKPEKYQTKSTFKAAGNNLMRPASKKECKSLANRIDNLNQDQKDQILRMLEQLESENPDF